MFNLINFIMSTFSNSKVVKDLQMDLAMVTCLLNGAVHNDEIISDKESSVTEITDAVKAKHDAIRLMMLNTFRLFIHAYCIYDSHCFDASEEDLFYETIQYMNTLRTKLGL